MSEIEINKLLTEIDAKTEIENISCFFDETNTTPTIKTRG